MSVPSQQELRDYYNREAPNHKLTYTYPWAQERRKRTQAMLRNEIPVDRFLDLGCGTGGYSLHLVEHDPGTHAVALDISQAALDMATPHPRIRYVCRSWDDDLTDLGKFDLCLAGESLEHAVDPWALMDRLRAQCKRFLITVPDQWPTLGFEGDGYGHLHTMDEEKARRLLVYVDSCESDGRWLYLTGE